jgi:hypothetical protein
MTIVNEQQRDQQSSPAFRTLEQKSMNLPMAFVEYKIFFG